MIIPYSKEFTVRLRIIYLQNTIKSSTINRECEEENFNKWWLLFALVNKAYSNLTLLHNRGLIEINGDWFKVLITSLYINERVGNEVLGSHNSKRASWVGALTMHSESFLFFFSVVFNFPLTLGSSLMVAFHMITIMRNSSAIRNFVRLLFQQYYVCLNKITVKKLWSREAGYLEHNFDFVLH